MTSMNPMTGWVVRIPASSANLGAGFDVLGMALGLHAEAGIGDPPGGALAVDFLGRYEDLDADLAKALRLIGVAHRLDVPKSNVGPNKETRQDYRSYYTPQTEALVREWYAPEIELLKYGF